MARPGQDGIGEPTTLAEIQHDDVLGDAVMEEEAAGALQAAVTLVLGEQAPTNRAVFPGSQPVSLARSNLSLLSHRRYWVTWKADGTRYLLLICMWGCYLIDRAFHVRRVHMRFPLQRAKGASAAEPAAPHHNTLLDGEMVVDEDIESGQRIRRYLAYDMMALNGVSLVQKPFGDRWQQLQAAVMEPRKHEMADIQAIPSHPRRYYQYSSEPFAVRCKVFWPLTQAGKLLTRLIPKLSHEADGLILQAYDDPYKVGTCEELLKWKFAHLNSVDFLLRSTACGPELYLLETRQGKPRSGLTVLQGASIIFPEEQNAAQFEGRIVECSWNRDKNAWTFMRERLDKKTPNAYHVYEKVMQSITDDIKEDTLLSEFEVALKNDVYARDHVIPPT